MADEQLLTISTFARAVGSRAHELASGRAVIAYLLEHNVASAVVARKVGLHLIDRGPDAGNPDPDAVRLVHADRELSAEELAAAHR